jgi:hypothetical protein
MNSEPSERKRGTVAATRRSAAPIVFFGWRSTQRHAGSYTLKTSRLIGCFSSG